MGPSICTHTARCRETASVARRSASLRFATVVHARNMRNSSAGERVAQVGNSILTTALARDALAVFHPELPGIMRDDYIKDALKAINDPNILINVVSRRV